MLTEENLRFARQIGATAIVVHMADYRRGGHRQSQFDRDAKGLDVSGDIGKVWTTEELVDIRTMVESHGLRLAALENLNPALWFDVLLDGPRRDDQIADVKTIIRNMGAAGIHCLGYNFTMAGVWGTRRDAVARGGALGVRFEAGALECQQPIPVGAVWNRVYDPHATSGTESFVSHDEICRRHGAFLDEVLPIAEESGVVLAAHPDDPPVSELRRQGRFMTRVEHFAEMISRHPSPANKLEFCIGTVAEMPGADIYATIEQFAKTDRIGYVHFRNVKGQVPNYHEVFVDEGDVDMIHVLEVLHRSGYQGVIIPDHTPLVTCDAPWHAGMAFAMGYMRAAMVAVRKNEKCPKESLSC